MNRHLAILLATLFVSVRVAAQVTLTEFLTANTRGPRDENLEFSDWIEIRNEGSTPVNLLGWTLTDDPARPDLWSLPSTNLPAGGFLLVFASGKDRSLAGRELHASFSLSAAGGYLALFPPESPVAATEYVDYPQQTPDVSFGLVADGRNFFNPPTPRAVNGAGLQDRVADTRFSRDRGFHSAPFDLVISTATPGAVIRYTTNGATPTVTVGIPYTGPIRIGGTTVVRAAAFRDGFQPSDVDTQSYLFIGDILRQSPDGRAPAGWPASWGNGQVTDYGMDPDIVNSATYRNLMTNALLALPTFCLVTDQANLFSTSTGIYANPGADGRAWERPASLELIHPDGRAGFQENCGVRIRGGFSRSTDNPKHAFRFYFREQYGKSRLAYPVFGAAGPQELEQFDLRTFQNYSWSFGGDPVGVFFRDLFSRDTQVAMGRNGERGDYFHLYVNGMYFGVFNSCERPEASFGEHYYGGSKDDYDVVKVEPDAGYVVEATDGNLAAWTRLYNAARAGLTNNADYFRIQGRDATGTEDPGAEVLVNVPDLIDYMLVAFYSGNFDAPVSRFLGESSPNNFFALRSRSNRMGFHFVSHDAEHTLKADEPSIDRTGPFSAGTTSVTKSNPYHLFRQMTANAEFRLTFADHVQRHFFNGGTLTTESVLARIARRTNELFLPVVAESARWGDSKRPTSPLTRDAHWIPAVRAVQQQFVGPRTATVLQQFRNKGWLPTLVAPSFSQHGGPVATGQGIVLSAPAGTVVYTVDGSDPRRVGGAVAPAARTFRAGDALRFADPTTVKARALNGTNWSALTEARFVPVYTFDGSSLMFSEVQYRPIGGPGVSSEDFEFVELKNVGNTELNLSGLRFSEGIAYVFPDGSRLAPGRFVVLVGNPVTFTNRHPGVRFDGAFTGRLSDGGERLTLEHAAGGVVTSVRYDNSAPWPTTPDGLGFSLVPVNPDANPDPDSASGWRASSAIGGSPGRDDPAFQAVPVVVNEVLTHTDPPQLDFIELHNPTANAADVSGWYLSDDRTRPRKFRLPSGTRIPAGGFLVFDELAFGAPANGTNAFRLGSHGEEVHLYSADAAGVLTGYSDGAAFGAAANGVSFGRHTNSVGDVSWPAQVAVTAGGANAGPRMPMVVINEILHSPVAGEAEFVELRNTTDRDIALHDPLFPTNSWRLAGVDFDFPAGAVIPANGLALVTSSTPEAARVRLGLPATFPVFGPFDGSLSDEGERVELSRPDSPDLVTNELGAVSVVVPMIVVDSVRYDRAAPWPVQAAVGGTSLERRPIPVHSDDPAAWFAVPGESTPGAESGGNRPPRVDAGSDLAVTAASFPATLQLSGTVVDDGRPGPTTLRWTRVSGSPLAELVSPESASTDLRLPGVGTWVYRLTAQDGERTVSDDVTVQVTRPLPGSVTLLPSGATWRYLDSAVAPSGWELPDFNDSGWSSGAAELGYGDGDETTTLSFGPNASSKRITYYFRHAFQVAGSGDLVEALLRLVRDDGGVVYLNGNVISRQNLPEGPVGPDTLAVTAVGGADESTFFESPFDPTLLREGRNVVAVELHQNSGSSSDLSFNLALTGRAEVTNRPPTVEVALADAEARVGVPVRLSNRVADDGLPSTPGVPTVTWTRVSGPGAMAVVGQEGTITTVRFDQAGEHRLRASVTDGVFTRTADLSVAVMASVTPPVGEVVRTSSGLALRFTREAGRSYLVQRRDDLIDGGWVPVETFPASSVQTAAEVALTEESASRFYRIVTPAL